MNEHYENIKSKTVCTECNGKEMHIAYLYEGTGIIKKPGKTLGITSYTGAGNMLMIVCKSCGFVAKSFAIGK